MINGGAFISAWTPRCLCRCCLPEFSTGSCMINGDLKKVPRSKVTRCMEYTCGCGERRGWEAAIVCGRICLSAPARVKPCSVQPTADCIESVILFCKDKQPLSSELPCTGSAFPLLVSCQLVKWHFQKSLSTHELSCSFLLVTWLWNPTGGKQAVWLASSGCAG